MKNNTQILMECNSDLNLRVLELKSFIVEQQKQIRILEAGKVDQQTLLEQKEQIAQLISANKQLTSEKQALDINYAAILKQEEKGRQELQDVMKQNQILQDKLSESQQALIELQQIQLEQSKAKSLVDSAVQTDQVQDGVVGQQTPEQVTEQAERVLRDFENYYQTRIPNLLRLQQLIFAQLEGYEHEIANLHRLINENLK